MPVKMAPGVNSARWKIYWGIVMEVDSLGWILFARMMAIRCMSAIRLVGVLQKNTITSVIAVATSIEKSTRLGRRRIQLPITVTVRVGALPKIRIT